jgi:cell division protein FtsB
MLKKWQNKRWYKVATNKYVLATLMFAIWMLFFDANSWLLQRELNAEIDELNKSIEYYTEQLETDRVELYELKSNPAAFEKYAREKFWMHREGEEIYVFEFVED